MLQNPAYRIDIYNYENTLIHVLSHESVMSLTYEICVNGVSPFTFTVDSESSVYGQLLEDYIVKISRYDPAQNRWFYEHCFFISLIEPFQNDNGSDYMLFGGLSCEDVLGRVIIDPDDDPLKANGYSTKSGTAESLMHAYVKEQRGANASTARQIPMSQSANLNRGVNTGLRLRRDNLLEVLQTLALQGIDFWMDFSTNALIFTTGYRGTDKRRRYDASSYLYFSKTRGNMLSPNATYDARSSSNVCYALGAGHGDNREVYKISTSLATSTPYARREFVHNAGSNQPGDSLKVITEATKQLDDKKPKRELTFKLGDNARYRIHWQLGDYCTAEYAGYENDYRITRVSVKVTGVKEEVVPTLELA